MTKSKLIHMESRASATDDGFEFLVQCEAKSCIMRGLLSSLKKTVDSVVLHTEEVPRRGTYHALIPP